RATGVRINVVDKMARKQYAVEPRQYEGRLLHQLPLLRTPLGDIYVELYLNEPSDRNCVALYRRGTRVIDDLTLLDHFARALDVEESERPSGGVVRRPPPRHTQGDLLRFRLYSLGRGAAAARGKAGRDH